MNARDALKHELRTVVGPYLREQGFRGSGSNWRKWSERGDCAIVNVQSSAYNSADSVRCVINLAVSAEVYFDWLEVARGPLPGIRRSPTMTWSLWSDRLHLGVSTQEQWWALTNEREARAAALDMIAQLEALGVPTLEALLDRSRLTAAVQGEPVPGFQRGPQLAKALPLLVSDEGDPEQLAVVLQNYRSRMVQPDDESFDRWVTDRAQRISDDRLRTTVLRVPRPIA